MLSAGRQVRAALPERRAQQHHRRHARVGADQPAEAEHQVADDRGGDDRRERLGQRQREAALPRPAARGTRPRRSRAARPTGSPRAGSRRRSRARAAAPGPARCPSCGASSNMPPFAGMTRIRFDGCDLSRRGGTPVVPGYRPDRTFPPRQARVTRYRVSGFDHSRSPFCAAPDRRCAGGCHRRLRPRGARRDHREPRGADEGRARQAALPQVLRPVPRPPGGPRGRLRQRQGPRPGRRPELQQPQGAVQPLDRRRHRAVRRPRARRQAHDLDAAEPGLVLRRRPRRRATRTSRGSPTASRAPVERASLAAKLPHVRTGGLTRAPRSFSGRTAGSRRADVLALARRVEADARRERRVVGAHGHLVRLAVLDAPDRELLAAGQAERLAALARPGTAAGGCPSSAGSSGGSARSSRRSRPARRAGRGPSPPSRATSPEPYSLPASTTSGVPSAR